MEKAMKKTVYGILTLIIAGCILCGCGSSKTTEDKVTKGEYTMVKEMISQTTELNERQKKIMEKEGLPTDFNQLSQRQQEAAIKIEMLMTYLEDKYDKEFVYEGYNDDYYGSLVARALDDNRCRKIQASLDYENGEYKYSDTYAEVVLAANEYENLFDEFMMENYPEPDYFVDIYVGKMDGEKITTNNGSVSLKIVLKSCFDTKDEYKEFLTAIAEWMQNEKYHNSIYCQVMDEEDFKEANYFNYTRLMREDRYSYCFDVDIDTDGSISVKEWD